LNNVADYDKDEVKARLDARLEEIETARRAVKGEQEDDQAARDAELSDYDQHPGDAGTETLEQELDETRLAILDGEEEQVRIALQRLEEGTYGTSVESGDPIPPERLKVMPEAIRTVEEQQRYDQLYGRATPPGHGV
jgi:DnaK suppressor protein